MPAMSGGDMIGVMAMVALLACGVWDGIKTNWSAEYCGPRELVVPYSEVMSHETLHGFTVSARGG